MIGVLNDQHLRKLEKIEILKYITENTKHDLTKLKNLVENTSSRSLIELIKRRSSKLYELMIKLKKSQSSVLKNPIKIEVIESKEEGKENLTKPLIIPKSSSEPLQPTSQIFNLESPSEIR